jgi:hypothetical protein
LIAALKVPEVNKIQLEVIVKEAHVQRKELLPRRIGLKLYIHTIFSIHAIVLRVSQP